MDKPINITISDALGKNLTFDSFLAFKEFAHKECEFWQKHRLDFQEKEIKIPMQVGAVSLWEGVLNSLIGLEDELESLEDTEINERLANLKQTKMCHFNSRWLWRGHPLITPWLKACEYSEPVGQGFLDFILKEKLEHTGNREWFKGYLLAYEFEFQEEVSIAKKREGESSAFDTLRMELADRKSELVANIDRIEENFGEWFETKKGETDTWIEGLAERTDKAIGNHSNLFNQMADHAKDRYQELEATYREKLRLDGPATYWKNRAKVLRWQGGLWVVALIALMSLGFFYLHEFFVLYLQGKPMALNLASFQGAIIFASILSAFAFGMRLLSRLALSSFHLQRDAEEREQLTHLYLSLVHEGSADTDSRDLVLQSLFSRSESGLISNESGPSMPTVGELITSASRVAK